MRLLWTCLIAALLGFLAPACGAEEVVQFPSLEDNGPGQPSTVLNGYLFRPTGEGPHPAVVGLHGCGGMLVPSNDRLTPLYRAWGTELANRGYVVLLVDSLLCDSTAKCARSGLRRQYLPQAPGRRRRAPYLQSQPLFRGDRICHGLVAGRRGHFIFDRRAGAGRPGNLPQGDFSRGRALSRACNEARQSGWATIPA